MAQAAQSSQRIAPLERADDIMASGGAAADFLPAGAHIIPSTPTRDTTL